MMKGSGIFRSVLSNHLFSQRRYQSNRHHVDASIVANLRHRGFGGTEADILEIYRPIRDYIDSVVDSANFDMANFELEYLPTLIRLMCIEWHNLQLKQCTDRNDIAVCLRVIMDSLKLARSTWRP